MVLCGEGEETAFIDQRAVAADKKRCAWRTERHRASCAPQPLLWVSQSHCFLRTGASEDVTALRAGFLRNPQGEFKKSSRRE